MPSKYANLVKKVQMITSAEHWKPCLTKLNRLGPFAPIFYVAFSLMGLLTLNRIFLYFAFFGRLVDEPKWWKIFLLGPRLDSMMVTFVITIPTLLLLFFPQKWIKKKYFKASLVTYLTAFTVFFVFMELATFGFMREYDLRPDNVFFEYLNHPQEVLGTILRSNWMDFLVILPAMYFSIRFFYKAYEFLLEEYRPWRWYTRFALVPIACAFLFLGIRSSTGHRPANLSTVSFSQLHLANEITLNSPYTLSYAIYRYQNETNPSEIYEHTKLLSGGRVGIEEANTRVMQQTLAPATDFVPLPEKDRFQRWIRSPFKFEKPLNIVMIIEESLGAEFTGILGGTELTPHYDRLSKEGLLFTNLYATGTRTTRGLEALVAGFLPTPGESVTKLNMSRHNFFTAGELFKSLGYETLFVYGGESNFDEMRGFFMGNGFTQIYDQPRFEHKYKPGVWGIHDEDLFVEANTIYDELSKEGKSFFSVMLSTSNHSPFDYPDGKIKLDPSGPKESHPNAIKYSDHAIGRFFEEAKKMDYYKNTLFLVVADHNTRVYGDSLVPIHKFHIPGFIIGPNVPVGRYEKLASQTDLLPTLIHFSGAEVVTPLPGRNLMTIPKEAPGRAIMQYSAHYAYRVEDDVVVLRPETAPAQFKYIKGKLVPEEKMNEELVRDALAHSLWPWNQYVKRSYHLQRK